MLTGQRRVGKGCLLQQLCNHIQQIHPSAHILYINKELATFAHIRTSDDLLTEVSATFKACNANECYLFIDEVPDIQAFEYALRSLQAEKA